MKTEEMGCCSSALLEGSGRYQQARGRSMDVINDLTSSLSSDLNSTELAKDLRLSFLAKSTAINGAVNLGIKLWKFCSRSFFAGL